MTEHEDIQRLPLRSEIPSEMKWKLEDIYATDTDWEAESQKTLALLPGIEAYRGRVGESAHTLLEVNRLMDELAERATRLIAYANMRKAEDNTNATYQALSDRAWSMAVQARSASAFVTPEITALSAATVEHYFTEEPALALYRHRIGDILRMAPHTLSSEEERIIALAGEATSGASNAFFMLDDADLKFPPVVDGEGQKVEVTHGRYTLLMESRNRRVRRDTFQSLYGAYREHRNTLAALLSGAVKTDVFNARARRYASARASALDEDNIPLDVYDNLISAVREFNPLMHRYVRLRRKMLGLEDLHMYDLYTPMVHEVEMKTPFGDACSTILKGLAPLGDRYLQDLQIGLNSRWIDILENAGKTSGAYSSSAYPIHPYVLMNYQDNLDNMFTLAHEMGHALHTHYTYQRQPFAYSDYSLFCAEVASTLNESLLMEHLLKTTTDRKQRLFLLNHYLETFRGTLFRQTMFAEFEKKIHEMAESGEALTPDALCNVYHQLNVDYYGPDVVVDPELDMEWARIPHFYWNFYVYKYATGFSAATALSQRILQEGRPAVGRYLAFLSAGGSDYPINELQQAGVDMTSPEPVRSALRVFERVLGEMENLAG